LLSFGITNHLFEIVPIKDIEKSCCKVSTTEVIDFDETKRVIISNINKTEIKMQEPKSCDALKIMPDINRLDFIEFKGLQEFIKRLPGNEEEQKLAVKEKLEKFDFQRKIGDSIFLLQQIFLLTSYSMTNEERAHFKKVEKNYFIMVDIDFEESRVEEIAFTLEFLSQVSDIKKHIIDSICNSIEGFQDGIFGINKTKLISKNNIDRYYSSLLPKAGSA
jgi:hypothetical protein